MTAEHDDDPGISPDHERLCPDEAYVPFDFDDPSTLKPTAKQLAYLRALADRAGQTFAYPRTIGQASREIRRLKVAVPSTRAERVIERSDLAAESAARQANCATSIRREEIDGYGSGATWSRRS